MNVALPSIGRALKFSQLDLSWVVNAYVLTFGGFLLLGGRLADLVGRRRMFTIGLVLFSLASLLGGLAQSDAWLIAARAVQGLGGAAGVLLGGVLTDGLSWRWVLFVNVPIGVAAALLAPRVLVESRSEDERRSFDAKGAVTVTAGLALLVYALVDAVNAGWTSTVRLERIGGPVALLAIFVALESRASHPRCHSRSSVCVPCGAPTSSAC